MVNTISGWVFLCDREAIELGKRIVLKEATHWASKTPASQPTRDERRINLQQTLQSSSIILSPQTAYSRRTAIRSLSNNYHLRCGWGFCLFTVPHTTERILRKRFTKIDRAVLKVNEFRSNQNSGMTGRHEAHAIRMRLNGLNTTKRD